MNESTAGHGPRDGFMDVFKAVRAWSKAHPKQKRSPNRKSSAERRADNLRKKSSQ